MGSEGSQWVVFPQNSGDPDEIPHCVAFHQGLHGLPRQYNIFFEITSFDPSIYTMDHPEINIICSFMENFIALKG